jgi:putative ABC transport system permease protein
MVRSHGAEMRAAFEERARAAHAAGALRLAAALARGVGDVVVHGMAVRLRPGRVRRDGTRRPTLTERMAMLGAELRLAARNLARRPGFTVVAALTLALGVGANVAMFTVVHSVVLRPLPFPDAERIVWIGHHAPGMELPELENSTGTLAVYRERSRTLAHVASVESRQQTLVGADAPARIGVGIVSPELFDVLGVAPARGRRLVAADGEPGAPPVAVLTHGGWVERFGGAADVVGRRFELDGAATEIVGVMPRGFAYPEPATAALLPKPAEEPVFGNFGIRGIARLAPGAEPASAAAELAALRPVLQERFALPEGLFEQAGWGVSVRTLRERTVGQASTLLWILLGAVGFLLLVACASVANLFLIRAESRQRELGVRCALGATRGRIAAALLSESVLLGLAGGAWGVLLAWQAVRVLVASGPAHLPRLHEISMGAPVLLFAGVVSLGAGLLFGLLPLPRQLRRTLPAVVRAGRGGTAGRDRQRLRRGLIVGQIALALVLLVGSGLMLRTFQQLRSIDPGIQAEGALVVGISGSERADARRAALRYLELLEAVRGVAGVRAAGLTTVVPVAGEGTVIGTGVYVEGRPLPEGGVPPVVFYAGVTDGYFAAAGTPLVTGRELSGSDVAHGRLAAVVNERFARAFLEGDPLEGRFRFGESGPWYEVVGVAADARSFGLREEIRPQVYLPITALPGAPVLGTVHLLARTDGAPAALAAPIRARVREVDPRAPVLSARPLRALVDASLADLNFLATVLATAALIALLLGAIGLYGVISYAVAERRGELGVRAALGATPGALRRLVLREGALLGALGVALGLAGAAALTRVLESVLFQVPARDPVTFAAVAGALLAVVLVASWLPAQRAARSAPLEAIRGTE